jgi:alanine-synthesizing transaminase
VHGYPPFAGLPELRAAIAEHYAREHGVQLDPDREVAVVPGTKTGIMLATLAAAGPRDGVLLPDPGYPDYRSAVGRAAAREVPLPLDPTARHQPDFDAVPAEERDRARLLVLNYPSNPCAVCAAPGTFDAAVAFAHAHGTWLLNDLAYGFLAFDGRRAASVLETEGARDVAIELWSPSKIYGMAGWRIGFAVGNRELIAAMTRVKSYLDYGAFTPIQAAACAALNGPQDIVEKNRQLYHKRRDVLVEVMGRAGWDIPAPPASMFAWAPLPPALREMGSLEFSKQLLIHADVAVAPGVGYGEEGEGYVRIALVENEQRLRQAARNVRRYFASLGINAGAVA